MSVDERLAAVERALTDDETAPGALSDAATIENRLAELESLLDEIETRVADLEAGLEAVRGHVGEERRDDRDLERTATSALATAREIERRLQTEAPPPRERPVPRAPDQEEEERAGATLLARLRDRLRDRP